MRLAFDASRLNRDRIRVVHHRRFITLIALRRPIFTCSARYTCPIPPSPSFLIT